MDSNEGLDLLVVKLKNVDQVVAVSTTPYFVVRIQILVDAIGQHVLAGSIYHSLYITSAFDRKGLTLPICLR